MMPWVAKRDAAVRSLKVRELRRTNFIKNVKESMGLLGIVWLTLATEIIDNLSVAKRQMI
jgi:hypothetical protein